MKRRRLWRITFWLAEIIGPAHEAAALVYAAREKKASVPLAFAEEVSLVLQGSAKSHRGESYNRLMINDARIISPTD